MSARKFTDSDLPQLKKDYKELKIYRLVGDKYDCNPETVRLIRYTDKPKNI